MDYDPIKALESVKYLLEYIDNPASKITECSWTDDKGYHMFCDFGYFWEGLRDLKELLEKRLEDESNDRSRN